MEKEKQDEADSGSDKKVIVPKKTADIQRYKLEKLMKNPDKPVYIPEPREQKLPRVFNPPEFIRNIWGSSAGVGSGDFHIYRNIRRRQYAREKYQDKLSEKDQLDMEYAEKVEANMKAAEEKTAKKRSKRQKKKLKQKAKKSKTLEKQKESESDSESESETEEPTEGLASSEQSKTVENLDNGASAKQEEVSSKNSQKQTETTNTQDSSAESDSEENT